MSKFLLASCLIGLLFSCSTSSDGSNNNEIEVERLKQELQELNLAIEKAKQGEPSHLIAIQQKRIEILETKLSEVEGGGLGRLLLDACLMLLLGEKAWNKRSFLGRIAVFFKRKI